MLLTEKLTKSRSLLGPITLFKRIEIHLLTPLLLFFALLYNFGSTLLLTYLIVLIHEMAHVVTALKLGVKPEKIVILPFGVTMQLQSYNIKCPKDEMKIAIAGPISNIIMGLISLGLFRYGLLSLELTQYLVTANCAIALINIVPALPLDGGRILRASLTESFGYVKAFNFTMLITKICAVLLCIGGIILLLLTHFNFSILIISAFLITNAVSEQRGSKLIMMREILYSRQKLCDSGIEKTGSVCIMRDTPARKALKFLTYNKYYMIHLIDEDMNVLASITETKLIEGLIHKGIRVKAGEIFNK